MSPGTTADALRRVAEVLVQEGMSGLIRKIRYKLRLVSQGRGVWLKERGAPTAHGADVLYRAWAEQREPTASALETMRATARGSSYAPSITVLCHVDSDDETGLRRTVESLLGQVYPNWELWLIDDGLAPHRPACLADLPDVDRRIRVRSVPAAEPDSGGVTVPVSDVPGEFATVVGMGDVVAAHGLFEVVRRLDAERHLALVYSDEDRLGDDGSRRDPFFKPAWSPELLLSMNYVGRLAVFSTELARRAGGLALGADAEHDLMLRLAEVTEAVGRVPAVLYHRRRPECAACTGSATRNALARRGVQGRVAVTSLGLAVTRYRLESRPLVSIIVPTRDRRELLERCLASLRRRTTYRPYQIIVVDNASREPRALAYLDSLADTIEVCHYPGSFNFAAINNLGATRARGDCLVFLNNDTEVLRGDWLDAMVEQAQRANVGAVGAKLLYADGRIQHAGMVLGVGGAAGHAFRGLSGDIPHYFGFSDTVRECSAVTAACMLVPRRVFEEVKGFDERFRVGLNDVDLCLRIRRLGYRVVYTPLAVLYHHEGATRARLHPVTEEELFWERWGDVVQRGDPYYNPGLTLRDETWRLRT